LMLAATPKRENVRDVLIYRDAEWISNLKSQISNSTEWRPGQSAMRGYKPGMTLKDFPKGATIATSSTRRKEQLLAARPDFKIVEIRGNVSTRMQKVADRDELD